MKIKTTSIFCLIPVIMAKINKKTMTGLAEKDVHSGEHLSTVEETAELYNSYGNQCGNSSRSWELIYLMIYLYHS